MTKVTLTDAMRAGFEAADKSIGFGKAIDNIAALIQSLKDGDKEGLAALRKDVILGIIARDLFGGIAATGANIAKAEAVLAKTGKARQEVEAEHKAEVNARKIWSRALGAAGVASSHGNAGNANAGRKATEGDKPTVETTEGDKPKVDKPIKAPVTQPDVMTRAAFLQGLTDVLATYISSGKSSDKVEGKIIARIAAWREEIAALQKEEK